MGAGLAQSGGFCNYPMWTIPDVGTETRCDHSTGCPKRTTDCNDLFGVLFGDNCTLVCANDQRGDTETVKCIGNDVWSSSVLDCSRPVLAVAEAKPYDGCVPTSLGSQYPDIDSEWCDVNCFDGEGSLATACDPAEGFQLCECSNCVPTEYGAGFPDVTEQWCQINCFDGEGNLATACLEDNEFQLCQCPSS